MKAARIKPSEWNKPQAARGPSPDMDAHALREYLADAARARQIDYGINYDLALRIVTREYDDQFDASLRDLKSNRTRELLAARGTASASTDQALPVPHAITPTTCPV